MIMEEYEKSEERKQQFNSHQLSSLVPDIDQLCSLIDENTFGLKTFSSSKLHLIPASRVKVFHSSRLKRLHTQANFDENENLHRPCSMRFSLSPSFVNQFRSLSTYSLPKSRRHSSSTITLFRTKSILSSLNEGEELNSSLTTTTTTQSPLGDARRTSTHSCNVEELTAYLDNFLYLPKSLSGAAELMYT